VDPILKRRLEIAASIIGLLLAVIALAFAIDQYWASRQQERELISIQRAVRGAAEAASTRLVGLFPANLPAIKEVVGSTCSHLVVMADVAGYAMFSQHKGFLDYFDAISDLSLRSEQELRQSLACHGVQEANETTAGLSRVRLVLYDPDVLEKTLRNQFRKADYDELKKAPAYSEFFNTHKEIPSTSNYDDFIADLKQVQLQYIIELANRGVDIRMADHRYMVYFWMHDKSEAAFSLDYQGDRQGDGEQEITFRSRDGDLTSAFQKIFELEWKNGKAVDPASLQKLIHSERAPSPEAASIPPQADGPAPAPHSVSPTPASSPSATTSLPTPIEPSGAAQPNLPTTPSAQPPSK